MNIRKQRLGLFSKGGSAASKDMAEGMGGGAGDRAVREARQKAKADAELRAYRAQTAINALGTRSISGAIGTGILRAFKEPTGNRLRLGDVPIVAPTLPVGPSSGLSGEPVIRGGAAVTPPLASVSATGGASGQAPVSRASTRTIRSPLDELRISLGEEPSPTPPVVASRPPLLSHPSLSKTPSQDLE